MQSESGFQARIRVKGEVDPGWSDWLGAMTVAVAAGPNGRAETVLCGPVPDQPALRGILIKLWDLNLELISLECIDLPAEAHD